MREHSALRKLKKRDPEGLRELMALYTPYVSAVVWGILGGAMSPQDCEEVASDVFLAAWEQCEDLRPGKARAWLGAVARNKAKNKLRDLGRDLPLEEDTLDLPAPGDLCDDLARAEEEALVRRAVDRLSPRDREVFLRHYFYGQTVERISAEMDLNPSTVKTKLRRGREKLKQILTKEGLVYGA